MRKNDQCLICERIRLIKREKNPYFVTELETGYVVMGDYQYFEGYTLLLCKFHKRELHELGGSLRRQFLMDMSTVAEAVSKAFEPQKLNYELLGNDHEHMHWHVFPRYGNDPEPKKAIWTIDRSIRCADRTIPTTHKLEGLKYQLKNELEKLS